MGVCIGGGGFAEWPQGVLITIATVILMVLSPPPSLLRYPNAGVLNQLP